MALDLSSGSGEEEAMKRSDAEILWEVASVLARDAAKVSREAGRPAPVLPPLLFFTDPDRTPRPWETAARLPAGSGVVFRHFGAAGALETARRLREATTARGGLLLIGLDAELAETVEADGVHLPDRALGRAVQLKALRPDWRISGAVHSAGALARAGDLDGAVISPVFPAGGVSSATPALGLERFRALARTAPCPAHALGGVEASNVRDLIGSGACGLAAVSAIQAAFGPD
jgi:thiamine-phosphate pyrophosphorylase